MHHRFLCFLVWGLSTLTALETRAASGIEEDWASVAEVDSAWSDYTSSQLFVEGSMLMEEGFWHEAARVWTYAAKSRPKNRVLKYRRALCLHNIGEDWPEIKAAFAEVVDGPLTERYDPFNPNQRIPPVEAWLWLASAEHRMMEFDAARTHVDAFLSTASEKNPAMEMASKILDEVRFAEQRIASPSGAVVRPLDLNSDAHESHPVLTADGKTLFYSSNRSRSNGSNHGRVDPNTKAHYFDIYTSTLSLDSTWSEPELLNVGLRSHATVVASDAFGEKLVVLDNDGWTHELKLTQRWERGWTVAESFDLGKAIPNQGEVAFFPSKDRLIASVEHRRGQGGFDLYESSRNEKGRWSRLKSLGVRVNTWGDEVTPFVAADGQTVFFASNGLEGMGGFDVYRTTRNAAGGWTEPEHLGSPINSVNDDMAFVIGAKGEVGYFATRRDVTRGDLDLYEAEMEGGKVLEGEVVILSMDAEGVDGDEQPEVLLVKDALTGAVLQRVERGSVEDVYNFILPAGGEFVLESEEMPGAEDGKSQTDEVPAVRRRIVLPEGSKSEVIAVTFEEVFEEVVEDANVEGANVNGQSEERAFVVQPQKTTERAVDEEVVEQASEPLSEEAAEAVEQEVAEEVVEVVVEEVVEEVLEEVSENEPKTSSALQTPASGGLRSEPIAPLALAPTTADAMLMAVQLYSGQVHTGRMDLRPVVEAVVAASKNGKPAIRIEGSASDGPSTRPGGNLELASLRAMDVYLRLVEALKGEGLVKGAGYEIQVVRRVQPDGDTPVDFANTSAHPASFQYVRVDLSVR